MYLILTVRIKTSTSYSDFLILPSFSQSFKVFQVLFSIHIGQLCIMVCGNLILVTSVAPTNICKRNKKEKLVKYEKNRRMACIHLQFYNLE